MDIEIVKVSEIKEYEKNSKTHPQTQIQQIKNSIRQFGNNDPIAIDENNVVIEGHGRLEALKQLGATEIPVIRLSHMTEEEKRAYIIVHNKTTMNSEFDTDLLNEELNSIEEIDMSAYGFDLEIEIENIEELPIEEEKEHHRETTMKQYNLHEYDDENSEGFYQMPMIHPTQHVPKGFIGFNYVLNKGDTSKCVHFFLDDYQFERIWNSPQQYIEKLKAYDSVLTPDFSLYLDMPNAMKIWNTYRSRLIGQMCQREGIEVIPTVSWGDADTFDYCFDGLPKHSVVAISTIGVKRDVEQFEIWKNGVDKMIEMLEPSAIIVYGGALEHDYGTAEVVNVTNDVTERMKKHKKAKKEE